ncbi:MAG: enoyl-CoA hydratase family protein [Polyangiaceae bacterium]
MTLSPKSFELEISGGVALITLNRPERLNALTFEVYGELRDTFRSLHSSNGAAGEARAVVITGKGRGFCSGGDVEGIIAELFAKDARGLLAFTRATGALIQAICECDKPVIAAVNGTCVGAGAVIATACDMRIASTNAKFGFIFPKVGLSGADMGASFLLPRIVGRGRAAELLFFGRIITATEAFAAGLVNKLVDEGQALSTSMEWARELAAGPAFAHTITKQMLESESTMSLAAAIEAEAQAQAICMAHPDFRTAYEANKKKEKPIFEGAPKASE